jgi:hypothetical protein
MNPKLKICSICGQDFPEWGNNAEPINSGRYCDQCNNIVIARRYRDLSRAELHEEKVEEAQS